MKPEAKVSWPRWWTCEVKPRSVVRQRGEGAVTRAMASGCVVSSLFDKTGGRRFQAHLDIAAGPVELSHRLLRYRLCLLMDDESEAINNIGRLARKNLVPIISRSADLTEIHPWYSDFPRVHESAIYTPLSTIISPSIW
jgi:hypothetical protein